MTLEDRWKAFHEKYEDFLLDKENYHEQTLECVEGWRGNGHDICELSYMVYDIYEDIGGFDLDDWDFYGTYTYDVYDDVCRLDILSCNKLINKLWERNRSLACK
jgi:hypothetical protein